MNDNIFLILTSQNFDLKLAGDKEEIRKFTDNYINKFCVEAEDGKLDIRQFKTVTFQRGYTKEKLIIEVLGTYCDKFIKFVPSGFKKGEIGFTLELGRILKHEKNG